MILAAVSTATKAQEERPAGPGEAVFGRACAACHVSLIANTASPPEGAPGAPTGRALPREMLRRLSAEAILAALTTGKMQAQGSALSEAERRAAA